MLREMALTPILLGMIALSFTGATNALLIWVWAALLDLNYRLYGFAAEVPYQKFFALVAIFCVLGYREKRRVYLDATIVFLVLWLFLGAVSQTITPFQDITSWQILDKLWKGVLLGVLVSWTFANRVRMYSLILAICLAIGVTAAWHGALFFATAGGHFVVENWSLGDNNELALLVDMVLPLNFYLYKFSERKFAKFGFMAVSVLSVACVIATRSRGGFVGLVVIALVTAMFSRRKVSSFIMIAIAAIGFSFAVPSTWTQRIDTIQKADQDDSFMGRVIAWKMSTLIALDRPLFGGGFHAVQLQKTWEHYSPEFYQLDFVPTEPAGPVARAAHSLYFELLGDTGFLGLALFMLAVASSFWNAFRIKRLSRKRDDLLWASKLASHMCLGLIVFLTAGAALSTTYMDINFLFFAILSATRRCVEDTVRQAAAASDSPARRLRARGLGPVPAPVSARGVS